MIKQSAECHSLRPCPEQPAAFERRLQCSDVIEGTISRRIQRVKMVTRAAGIPGDPLMNLIG